MSRKWYFEVSDSALYVGTPWFAFVMLDRGYEFERHCLATKAVLATPLQIIWQREGEVVSWLSL